MGLFDGSDSWISDVSTMVDGWFSDSPAEVSQQDFMTEEYKSIAPIEPDYNIQNQLTTPEYQDMTSQPADPNAVFDTSEQSWDATFDDFFTNSYNSKGSDSVSLSSGGDSDQSLLDKVTDFASSDKGSGLIGGLLSAGGQLMMQKDQQDYLEEQARLAHERALEMKRSSPGRAAAGKTERVTSNLSNQQIKR